MVLIDSGAQYDCGTTDVTRTIHLGAPSQIQKECFTRVLKRMRCTMDGVDALLVVALDEIAWLFNMRGSDLPTTPCF
ncbi:hypothetical protein T492DRAFT_861025 [Pavlovales sp. CCMP2436]|nr:hypothetical protein T492DRAFT_861025 [Pavlovales sp. CCMP2436]